MAAGNRFTYPILATGPSAATGATSWVWTAYVELVPVSTITTPFAIEGLTYKPNATASVDTRFDGQFSLATGGAGSEVEIIQFPFAQFVDSAVAHEHAGGVPMWLPEGVQVAANTRIAVRVAWSGGTKLFGEFKLHYKEMGVAFPFRPRNDPRTYVQLRR